MAICRDRGWRRAKASACAKRRRRDKCPYAAWGKEKKFRLLYLRSNKLKRAQQLGFDYPRRTTRDLIAAASLEDNSS